MVTPTMRKYLDDQAKARKVSMADVLREMLDEALEHRVWQQDEERAAIQAESPSPY
jgi:hypothetical protein